MINRFTIGIFGNVAFDLADFLIVNIVNILVVVNCSYL